MNAEEQRSKAEEAAMDTALTVLREHYDCVAIVCSRMPPDDGAHTGTPLYNRMEGNRFACTQMLEDYALWLREMNSDVGSVGG
jgi:hypothetical protein